MRERSNSKRAVSPSIKGLKKNHEDKIIGKEDVSLVRNSVARLLVGQCYSELTRFVISYFLPQFNIISYSLLSPKISCLRLL